MLGVRECELSKRVAAAIRRSKIDSSFCRSMPYVNNDNGGDSDDGVNDDSNDDDDGGGGEGKGTRKCSKQPPGAASPLRASGR